MSNPVRVGGLAKVSAHIFKITFLFKLEVRISLKNKYRMTSTDVPLVQPLILNDFKSLELCLQVYEDGEETDYRYSDSLG